ncbi:MAG: hypothetical protein ABFS56_30015 [Pseudomonadota bacterium]
MVINAQIKGSASSDSSCSQTKVEQKVWVKLPNDSIISVIEPFTILTLLPFDSIEIKIFEYTFSGGINAIKLRATTRDCPVAS